MMESTSTRPTLELDQRTMIRACTILALELGAERVLAIADQVEHASSYNEPERLAGALRVVARSI